MKQYRRYALAVAPVVGFALLLMGCGGDGSTEGVRPTGSVAGTVTIAGQQTPVEGAVVQVEETAGEITSAQLQGTTDEQGYYRIDDVSSGVRVFACSKSGFLTTRRSVNIGSSVTNTVDFQFTPGP
ncbi:MAG: carboxypeptidase regulatory-like domain-containing protein [Armatimonadota bacterium]